MMAPDHGKPNPELSNGWPARRAPSVAMARVIIELEEQAKQTAMWLGERISYGLIPPAERAVLDCLRKLQSLPETERMYADELTDAVARVFLETRDPRNRKRRLSALLRIAAEVA